MKIEELQKLQQTNTSKQILINSIKDILNEYNNKCDEFLSIYSGYLTEFIINDVSEFLKNSKLEYTNITSRRYSINNTGIEISVSDEAINIGIKEKEWYKTFIIEINKENEPKGFINKHINVDDKLIYTGIEETFINSINVQNKDEIHSVYERLREAIRDAKEAIDYISNLNEFKLSHYYYEYRNESNKYNTIKEMIECEL